LKNIIKITAFVIALVLLFSNVAFAESYGRKTFYANQTKESTKTTTKQNQSQINKTKTQQSKKQSKQSQPQGSVTTSNNVKIYSDYKTIPRTVTQTRDTKIEEAFKEIKKGKSYYYVGAAGTYKYQEIISTWVSSREPVGTIIDNWQLTNLKRVEQVVEKTGSYILHVSGNLNDSTYTNTNTRVKDYTWTVKNETTGTTTSKFVTKENYTYITFYEPGTYYIKAEETLIYDVNRVDRVTYQITASHTGETLQSGTKTRTTYIESKTTPGKVTEWRIVITEEDLGKKIPIGDTKNNTGPKPISKSSSEPSNKINVEVDYELVE